MDLSIIIPVYNEKEHFHELISRVDSLLLDCELIIIDDNSNDGTTEIIRDYKSGFGKKITKLFNNENLGKGSCIRRAIPHCNGNFITIQDADLEYDPQDFIKLLQKAKVVNGVVYGSRNLQLNRFSSRRFYQGGRFLSELASFLFGAKITDESTCYKMFPAEILKSIPLKAKRFEFCPEITGKLMQNKVQITEIPINYYPRTHEDGKKIRWTDGFFAIWMLLELKLIEVLQIVHLPWEIPEKS